MNLLHIVSCRKRVSRVSDVEENIGTNFDEIIDSHDEATDTTERYLNMMMNMNMTMCMEK